MVTNIANVQNLPFKFLQALNITQLLQLFDTNMQMHIKSTVDSSNVTVQA